MKELSDIYKEVGQQFIDDLFKDYLTVTEKLSGSSFSFEKDNNIIKFYKSNDKPINLIDRTLMVYYESAISYIKRATLGIMTTIPDNWRFCFQYFVHNEPGVIQYDNLPKNNLVLTHIQIKSASGKIGKIIEDPRVIGDWANALNVTPLLPVFKGYLTDIQKQKIRDFISTPKEDHAELFKTSSFASYLIHVLNPSVKATTLQSDLAKPIDSIVFKFYKAGSTQMFSAKMIDPYTLSLMKDKKLVDLRRVPADINEILLLDILAFIEERGLKKGEILSISPDERYLELVSSIFNDYIIKRSAGLKEIDIEKAEFAKGDEFKLNIDLIPSESTKNTVRDNERMQDLFKIMLGSLRKKRNPDRGGNVLTPSVINDFNLLVDKIEDAVNTEVTTEFKTFGDYLNLKNVNESDENADELVIKEKSLSINEFVHLNKINLNKNTETMKYLKSYDSFYELKINENRGISKQKTNWLNSYNKFSKVKDAVNPKSEIKGELLRANFGFNDGTAETEIQNFLLKEIGIKRFDYTIEQILVGTRIPNLKNKPVSSDYDSYQIIFINDVKDNFGDFYKKNDVIYVTNRFKVSKKTGEGAVIGKKNLTPDAMGLGITDYKNAQSLYSSVEQFINKTAYPENYKNFILGLSKEVMNSQKNQNSYKDFAEYANVKKPDLIFDVSKSLFDGIDQISINNFQNDYGEVLGGFMLFNVLKESGSGLQYPSVSNERLVDFYFNGYSVSSKAGGGGTPTGDTLMQKINSSYNEGQLSFDSTKDQDFYNNVIKQWVNPPKLDRRSNTFNNIMNLCNVNIPMSMNSGYWYILSQANLQPNNATRTNLISYLDNLSDDENEFKNVINQFFNKTGINQRKLEMNKVYPLYVDAKKSNDNDRIGFIFYPMMVEITNDLNKKYQSELTKYGQMVTDIKQIYLDVQVTKAQCKFRTVPFSKANFKFEQKGSIPNPFNSNMGIKIGK